MLANTLLWEGLLYVVLGAIVYFLDGAYGTRVYRAVYNQTHKDPLGSDVERGYLVGRTVRGRFPVAIILSITIAVVMYMSLRVDLVPLIIKTLVFIPLTLSLGFFIAALIKRSGGVEKVGGTIVDVMENVEAGKVKPGDAVSSVVKDGAAKVRSFAHDAGEAITKVVDDLGDKPASAPTVPHAKDEATQPVPPAPEPPKPSFDEALNRFKGKG